MKVRYLSYKIEYKWLEHEILCPKYIFADGTYVLVIPWYLIPGRAYPIQVYLYACGLYSSNPDLGQRGAAKATRTEFGLAKFSHSTVSRSFKSFEQARKKALESRFGEELKPCCPQSPMPIGVVTNSDAKNDEAAHTLKRFPSVMDTAERRKEMAVFLQRFLSASKEGDIETAGRQFVKYWHKKTQRLLL